MDQFLKQRKQIVENLEAMGYIKAPEVRRAMLKVKRELFVFKEYLKDAYLDVPLQIPGGATISAPHMHAISLSALKLKPGDKVLEVGAGSGILLAYMKKIVGDKGKVFGIEITPETFEFAKKNLEKAGYSKKVKLILGDGSMGLPEDAPFDKILVSATAPDFPKPLIDQLKVGGIIISIIGPPSGHQELVYVEKAKEGKLIRKNLGGVVFVPLTGKYGWKK
jgi:protein-L-isoaspartate(D-aspartate) O-methyltransferase